MRCARRFHRCGLWWVAIAVLLLWLIGFVARPKGSGESWYRR
ncbi:hypothetical protein ABZ957_19730 [Streptomyces sp. NPDC046316]